MHWFRWYHGTVTDTKFTQVARLSGLPKTTVLAIWASLMEYASKDKKAGRGCLAGFDASLVAANLEINTEAVETVCNTMKHVSVLHTVSSVSYIKNWLKRQPKREQKSTERVRKFRNKNSIKSSSQIDETRFETQCNTMKHDETPETLNRVRDINKNIYKAIGQIPANFWPSEAAIARAYRAGCKKPTSDDIVYFIEKKRSSAYLSGDWDAEWVAWAIKGKSQQLSAAKAHIESQGRLIKKSARALAEESFCADPKALPGEWEKDNE